MTCYNVDPILQYELEDNQGNTHKFQVLWNTKFACSSQLVYTTMRRYRKGNFQG